MAIPKNWDSRYPVPASCNECPRFLEKHIHNFKVANKVLKSYGTDTVTWTQTMKMVCDCGATKEIVKSEINKNKPEWY